MYYAFRFVIQQRHPERVLGMILVSPLCRAPTWSEWLYNKVQILMKFHMSWVFPWFEYDFPQLSNLCYCMYAAFGECSLFLWHVQPCQGDFASKVLQPGNQYNSLVYGISVLYSCDHISEKYIGLEITQPKTSYKPVFNFCLGEISNMPILFGRENVGKYYNVEM